MNLIEEISSRLRVLDPSTLEIIDESMMHAGHSGNTGGGHYKLKMISSHFCEKSQIMRHRLIYQLLTELIPSKIHALSIDAVAPNEL